MINIIFFISYLIMSYLDEIKNEIILKLDLNNIGYIEKVDRSK